MLTAKLDARSSRKILLLLISLVRVTNNIAPINIGLFFAGALLKIYLKISGKWSRGCKPKGFYT
jgi:hypothetical protein